MSDTTLTRKQARDLVMTAWHALPFLSGSGWGDGKDKLQALAVAEEKQHRKGAPGGYRHATTVRDAARLLCIADIARALLKPEAPTWDAFLSRRPSWLLAAALADVNREAILKAWERDGLALEALVSLDYADFVG